MASLSDQIDRLSRNTRAIRATTARPSAAVPGPFTRAVLYTPLGDLIRDVDPSELGLFSLPALEITRAEFTGATPLKRAPSRRDDASKAKDYEPEVYAHAALKCIDRYSGVRPMPRAHAQVTAILQRLNLVRENILNLTESLQQVQAVEGPPLKMLINEEEERVENLQTRLRALQEQSLPLMTFHQKSATAMRSASRRLVSIVPPPSQALTPSSPQEDSFWNTPATRAKTLRFTDNILNTTDSLLNEQINLGDISSISCLSPEPPSWTAKGSLRIPQDNSLQFTASNSNLSSTDDIAQNVNVDVYQAEKGEDKKIVVITEARTPPSLSSSTYNSVSATPSHISGVQKPGLRLNSEVESIVARIWTTIGDMIMPGFLLFDTSHGDPGSQPPRAKETMCVVDPTFGPFVDRLPSIISAHLQSLSDMSPSPTSPSVSSVSSTSVGAPATPTSQQILTAHLLISLLSSPPRFSLPLNKVKDLLADKASSGGGIGATGTTRILYGCVAKRLLKIDRSGGEQVVKFDVQ
ncbi:hypothetical protein C0992_006150 [Termitomyces sp. T32_za158]|nr:hypothetical protein C0992_006150 [Termitomyces sp. T32_za158]